MFKKLTKKELRIIELIAHGYSNTQISEELNIAEVTTKTHISNIYNKLHMQMDAMFNERLLMRIRLTLFYLKHINVLKNDWEIKNEQ